MCHDTTDSSNPEIYEVYLTTTLVFSQRFLGVNKTNISQYHDNIYMNRYMCGYLCVLLDHNFWMFKNKSDKNQFSDV